MNGSTYDQGQLPLDFDADNAPVSNPRAGRVADPRPGGLWIHRAERADRLVVDLAELLSRTRQDAFESDLISVPTKGVERWLTQRLSHILGVSAAIDFPSPSQLMSRCLATVGPGPDEDPWSPQRLVYPMLTAIDSLLDHEGFALLRRYIQGERGHAGGQPGRRWAAAQLMSDLFTDYGAQRPDMLRAWSEGLDVHTRHAPPNDLAWQPVLFRTVRDRVGVEFPAARTPEACALLRADPSAIELPGVVSLFGPTRLARDQLDMLVALAEHREVHLWLIHPSPAMWEEVGHAIPESGVSRGGDLTAELIQHPLLESWGRDCREMQVVLTQQTNGAVVDRHRPVTEPSGQSSRLRELQAALRQDLPTPLTRGRSSDNSIQIHACHGPARQVEVLRETLLHLLQDDPTLSPRDIVVMCPDVNPYAPLLGAAFGLSETLRQLDSAGWEVGEDVALHPGQQLRIRVADRALHQSNPILAMVVTLLDLATRRLTVSQLLDFAAQPVVRRRFQFSEEDLERIREWAQASGVRWGLNGDHRGLFGVAGVQHNTWAAGLDRLLVGVAMGESGGYVGTGLPLNEVDSTQIDLAGRWTELVSRVGTFMQATMQPRSVTAWVRLLNDALVRLAAVDDSDAWQRAHAEQALSRITADIEGIRFDEAVPLSAADVRQLVRARFAGRPTRAGFRTGDITVCTLAPMRSVPHRVICLLGMDDGLFPRRSAHEGENVLLRQPLVGERDRNSEDRQLLLDAVMAATETLVILYSGADEVTGRATPPAVPVAELLDVVGPCAVTRHPLQPFDERNFSRETPFSFDALARDAAQVRRGPSHVSFGLLDTSQVPPLGHHAEVVDLEDLIQFYVSPPRAYLRIRLGLVVRSEDEVESEQVPLDARGLAEWAIADRMLKGILGGMPLQTAAAFERRRGSLPPAELGTDVLERVSRRVERLKDCVDGFLDFDPRTEAVRVELQVRPGETAMVIQGVASGLRENRVLTVTPSRLAAQHRIRSWIATLALAAGTTRSGWQGVTLGRAERGDSLRLSMLTAPEPDDARAILADLVRIRRLGLDMPLPLPLKTSGRYAETRQYGQEAHRALDDADALWRDSRFDGEQSRPEFTRIWGDLALRELASLPVDLGTVLEPTHWPGEAGSFGRLARQIWKPLLDAEEMSAG